MVTLVLLEFGKQLQKAIQSQTTAKKPIKNQKFIDLKSMNNTKANRLKTGLFSKKANSGHICANKIRETALYSLEGSLDFRVKLQQRNR